MGCARKPTASTTFTTASISDAVALGFITINIWSYVVGFISTDAETDLVRRDESASVEKTVAFYRQIPSTDAKMHPELFAASAAESVTALITQEHSDSPTNCRLEM
jgi:hypothetical protein